MSKLGFSKDIKKRMEEEKPFSYGIHNFLLVLFKVSAVFQLRAIM